MALNQIRTPGLLLAILVGAAGCSGGDSAAPGTDSDTPADSAGTDPGSPTMGMWVWDTELAGDEAATSALLQFSAERGVGSLFLTCDPVGYGLAGAVERYTTFVDAAHRAGLEVYGVSGSPWFSVPCDAGLAGQPTCWTEGWDVYAACASSGVAFDGIMDDTEPASTPDGSWSTDYEERALWHLEYLDGIRDRIGDLPFHHAISASYDDLPPFAADESGETQTLDVWISRRVDVMGVMAYRDTAQDVLAWAEGELSRSPVWIGVETGPSTEGENVTFQDDGSAALYAALDEMAAQVGTDPNLRGFMVDSYESWSVLGD